MRHTYYIVALLICGLTLCAGTALAKPPTARQSLELALAKVPVFKGAKVTPFALSDIDASLGDKSLGFEKWDISPDGKRLLVSVLSDRSLTDDWRIYEAGVVYEFATKKSWLPKIPQKEGEKNFCRCAWWDPLYPDSIYIESLLDNSDNAHIWHIRYDGADHKLVSNPDEDTAIGLFPVSRQILVTTRTPPLRPEEGRQYRYFLQSIDDPSKRNEVATNLRPHVGKIMSPNERYFIDLVSPSEDISSDGFHITVHDTFRKAQIPLVSYNHFLFGMPDSIVLTSIGNYGWLPDSSGLFAMVDGVDNRGKIIRTTLWTLKLNGEMLQIGENIEIRQNSINGKHWIFRVNGDSWFLVSTK